MNQTNKTQRNRSIRHKYPQGLGTRYQGPSSQEVQRRVAFSLGSQIRAKLAEKQEGYAERAWLPWRVNVNEAERGGGDGHRRNTLFSAQPRP